jgi:hypothetical protein
MIPQMPFLPPHEIGAELLYSFVIIICSLMIYFSTKEMYDLSAYKGIKYFRQAFLYFAIAFFFRYFINFIIVLFNVSEIREFSPMHIGWLSLFWFMYFSFMAAFYLLYSVVWKKWNHDKTKIYVFNAVAIPMAAIGALIGGVLINAIITLILLLVILAVVLIAYKDSDKHKGKSMYAIYLMLFVFWILNIVDIIIPRFLEMVRLLIYLVSIFLFMFILYKVLRKTGN